MALRYDKGPRDWPNLFAIYITMFGHSKVLFPIFYYFCGKENRLLYRGQVHYSEFPLYKAKRQWVLKIIRKRHTFVFEFCCGILPLTCCLKCFLSEDGSVYLFGQPGT